MDKRKNDFFQLLLYEKTRVVDANQDDLALIKRVVDHG
jgi:hypothetical protein